MMIAMVKNEDLSLAWPDLEACFDLWAYLYLGVADYEDDWSKS